MGCKKITYYQEGGLAKNFFLKVVGSEKRVTEQKKCYSHDHLGNTRVVYTPLLKECNTNSPIISYTLDYAADYYPAGKILREFNPKAEKYLSTHHERDTETGLDYRGARYYDADVPHFLSLDPFQADFASWSPYNYVLGNPIRFIDPDGKAPVPGDDKQRITNPNNRGKDVVTAQNKGGARTEIKAVQKEKGLLDKIHTAFVHSQGDATGPNAGVMEGSDGFSKEGGKELLGAAVTFPISIIAAFGSGGGIPAAAGAVGLANNVDDFTSDGKSTFVEKTVPGGGVLKLGANVLSFGTNTSGIIKGVVTNTPSKFGFGFDLFNTVLSEGQTLNSVINEVGKDNEK